MELDLTAAEPTQSYDLLELAKLSKRAINSASRDHLADKEPRRHLGASVIGAECLRAIWYDWRWVNTEQFDGRMLRLFDRGHHEEVRNTKWLELAGFEVVSHQERISFGYGDHGGGSSDKIVIAAPSLGIGATKILVEEKTHNKKSFMTLVPAKGPQKSVKDVKGQHWLQANTYAHKLDIDLIMYFPVCKDDDSIEPQFHMVDHATAEDTMRKADDIILSQQPPLRAFRSNTNYKCKHFCHHTETCWSGTGSTIKSCRSCKFAKPGLAKTWLCGKHGDQVIPDDFILKACGHWEDIA